MSSLQRGSVVTERVVRGEGGEGGVCVCVCVCVCVGVCVHVCVCVCECVVGFTGG